MIPPVGLPSEAGSTYFATGFGSFALLGDITFVAKILSMLEEPGDFYNSYRNLRPVLQTSKTLAGLAKRLLPIWLAQKSSLAPFTSGQLVRIAQSVGSELKNLYSSAAEPLRIRDLYDLAYFCPNIESLHLPLGFENRTQPPLSQVFNRFSGLQVVNDQNVLYTRSEKKWKTEAELIGLQSDCVRYLVSEEPQSGEEAPSTPAESSTPLATSLEKKFQYVITETASPSAPSACHFAIKFLGSSLVNGTDYCSVSYKGCHKWKPGMWPEPGTPISFEATRHCYPTGDMAALIASLARSHLTVLDIKVSEINKALLNAVVSFRTLETLRILSSAQVSEKDCFENFFKSDKMRNVHSLGLIFVCHSVSAIAFARGIGTSSWSKRLRSLELPTNLNDYWSPCFGEKNYCLPKCTQLTLAFNGLLQPETFTYLPKIFPQLRTITINCQKIHPSWLLQFTAFPYLSRLEVPQLDSWYTVSALFQGLKSRVLVVKVGNQEKEIKLKYPRDVVAPISSSSNP